MPSIRYARSSDAKRLAVLAEETFRDTFGDANTTENMNLHCRTSYGESIQLAEISNAGMTTLLGEHGEDLAAFAQLRWGGAPACVHAKSPGEIQRLYVAKSWHGKGIAYELMASCIKALEDRKSDVVWLGVWERNPRAMAFYRKFGFVEVGDHVFQLGTDPQRDIIMARPLSG